MPDTKITDRDFVWYFTFDLKRFNANLGKLIKETEKKRDQANSRTKSGMHKSLNKLYNSKIRKLNNISRKVSTGKDSEISRIIRVFSNNFRDNIDTRVKQRFYTSNRLQMAIADRNFVGFQYAKTFIRCGIANKSVLDEYTSIYITKPISRENKGRYQYDPPGEYGMESWWAWQEFSGTRPKTNFSSEGSLWWVLQPHRNSGKKYNNWLGGFRPRHYIVKNNDLDLYREDQQLLTSMSKRAVNVIREELRL